MTLVITNTDFLAGDIYPDQTTDNPIIFYQSIYDIAGITATPDLNPDHPATNLWNPDTASTWWGETTGVPGDKTEFIDIHNINELTVNYISIASHNLSEVGESVSIIAQSSPDGILYSSVQSGANVPVVEDNTPIVIYFSDITDEYFRILIDITSLGSPIAQNAIVGHVKIGQATVLQRRVFAGETSGSLYKNVRRTQNMSDNGEYLGQVVLSTKRTQAVSQENNTPAFVRDNIVDFISHTQGEATLIGTSASTFFYAWRPTSYPDDVVYGWTMDEITPAHQSGDSFGGRMNWSFNMECLT